MCNDGPVIQFQLGHSVLALQVIEFTLLERAFCDINTHDHTASADDRDQHHHDNQCMLPEVDVDSINAASITRIDRLMEFGMDLRHDAGSPRYLGSTIRFTSFTWFWTLSTFASSEDSFPNIAIPPPTPATIRATTPVAIHLLH